MAERRMFAKTIIDSDAFLDMPLSTQTLYFHLSMRADDDGFVNNPKKIQRMVGASDDDLKLLILKRFILVFDSGVIVIKHWRIHNYIQKDRYKPTIYKEEKASLELKENGAYTERSTECIQDVSSLETQVSIGKVSIGEDSIGEVNITSSDEDVCPTAVGKKRTVFVPPSLEEVKAYCQERNNSVDAEQFIDFYTAKGWMIGKNKMKDWRGAVRTWERNRQGEKKGYSRFGTPTYKDDLEDFL